MSAKGEYFIDELKDEASRLGFFDFDEDEFETPEEYYHIWSYQGIPESDSFELGDGSTLSYTGYYQHDDEFPEFVITTVSRDAETKQCLTDKRAKGDWIHQLQPIVLDLLDGESELTKEDVDWLIPILRAKIEYYNGLITKDEYETIINNSDN